LTELLRWATEQGPIVVEIDSHEAGFNSVGRPGEVIRDVSGRFEDSLSNVRHAAVSALEAFQDKTLNPDNIEIELGVKINAEAGAVIAKTAFEGHMIVKLSWIRAEPKAN
jgi:NTP-dependent ternary system trypsin peptidase co-occuring protein